MEKKEQREPVQDCLDRFAERFAGQGLRLKPGLGDAALMIDGDSDRLEQLVNNLLENSIRYTDAGGQVRVSLERTANQVLLRVEDTAPGVLADALPRLTDRLFRAEQSRNREYGGAGLGLAIAANIVKAHGAEMQISASELGGLKVEIRFAEAK